jgi:hypothetical protein
VIDQSVPSLDDAPDDDDNDDDDDMPWPSYLIFNNI